MFAVVKLIHCHNEHGSQCPLKFIRCISEFCSIVFLSSVTCEKPPDVENAVHDGDPNIGTYPSGKQLLYTCDYGYYANGEARAMCNGEGQWVGLTLLCTRELLYIPTIVKIHPLF